MCAISAQQRAVHTPCFSQYSDCANRAAALVCRVRLPDACPSRVNMAHVRQSGPDSGLGFQVKILELSRVAPSSLGSRLYVRNLRGRLLTHPCRLSLSLSLALALSCTHEHTFSLAPSLSLSLAGRLEEEADRAGRKRSTCKKPT